MWMVMVKVEIVTGGYYVAGPKIAQLCIWDGSTLNFENVKTWYWTSDTNIHSVCISDVDDDGHKEIITAGEYSDGTKDIAQLCVWGGATLGLEQIKVWNWVSHTQIYAVSTGDVDNDGKVEIVTGGQYFDSNYNSQLCIWDGSTLAIKSIVTWKWISNTFINSVALGDVDSDGKIEISTAGYYNDLTRNVAQLCIWSTS